MTNESGQYAITVNNNYGINILNESEDDFKKPNSNKKRQDVMTNNILYESNEVFKKPNSNKKRQDVMTNNILYESRSNCE